jgi:hypothetical protein
MACDTSIPSIYRYLRRNGDAPDGALRSRSMGRRQSIERRFQIGQTKAPVRTPFDKTRCQSWPYSAGRLAGGRGKGITLRSARAGALGGGCADSYAGTPCSPSCWNSTQRPTGLASRQSGRRFGFDVFATAFIRDGRRAGADGAFRPLWDWRRSEARGYWTLLRRSTAAPEASGLSRPPKKTN